MTNYNILLNQFNPKQKGTKAEYSVFNDRYKKLENVVVMNTNFADYNTASDPSRIQFNAKGYYDSLSKEIDKIKFNQDTDRVTICNIAGPDIGNLGNGIVDDGRLRISFLRPSEYAKLVVNTLLNVKNRMSNLKIDVKDINIDFDILSCQAGSNEAYSNKDAKSFGDQVIDHILNYNNQDELNEIFGYNGFKKVNIGTPRGSLAYNSTNKTDGKYGMLCINNLKPKSVMSTKASEVLFNAEEGCVNPRIIDHYNNNSIPEDAKYDRVKGINSPDIKVNNAKPITATCSNVMGYKNIKELYTNTVVGNIVNGMSGHIGRLTNLDKQQILNNTPDFIHAVTGLYGISSEMRNNVHDVIGNKIDQHGRIISKGCVEDFNRIFRENRSTETIIMLINDPRLNAVKGIKEIRNKVAKEQELYNSIKS